MYVSKFYAFFYRKSLHQLFEQLVTDVLDLNEDPHEDYHELVFTEVACIMPSRLVFSP